VIAVGLLLVLVGFAMVIPRGALPGSAAARNVSIGPWRMGTTRGYDGEPSSRFRLIQVLSGIVMVAGGVVIIAVSS
jgi:hypothetical protein